MEGTQNREAFHIYETFGLTLKKYRQIYTQPFSINTDNNEFIKEFLHHHWRKCFATRISSFVARSRYINRDPGDLLQQTIIVTFFSHVSFIATIELEFQELNQYKSRPWLHKLFWYQNWVSEKLSSARPGFNFHRFTELGAGAVYFIRLRLWEVPRTSKQRTPHPHPYIELWT